MSSNRDQIHIYVDISNIFHDYHGRIDVNGLVDVVSNSNQREVMRKVAVGSISAHSTTKSEQERPWIEQNFEITFLSRIRGENGECEQRFRLIDLLCYTYKNRWTYTYMHIHVCIQKLMHELIMHRIHVC
jgi:hypothetical protein